MRNLTKLLAYVRPHTGWLVAGLLLLTLVGLLEGGTALLFWPLLQLVQSPAMPPGEIKLLEFKHWNRVVYLQEVIPTEAVSAAWLVLGTIVIVYVVKAAADYIGQYSTHRLGYAVVTDLRNALYAHTMRQSLAFFQRQSTGKLMASVLNDIERVQLVTSHVLADLFRQTATLAALLVVMFVIDWRLSLACLLAVPLIIGPSWFLGRRIRRLSRAAQDKLGEVSETLQETYTGIRVVQAFGMESWEIGRFFARTRDYLLLNLRWVRHYALASPLMEIVGALTVGGLILYATSRISAGELSAGMMTAFFVAFIKVYQPVKRLVGFYGLYQQALGASEKVFERLEEHDEVAEAPGAVDLPRFSQRIEFDGVSFRYPDHGELLQDITFSVEAGRVAAIVGPSGAGKTTLANLLPRFYDVTAGAVRIDGQDIRRVGLESLRGQIGIVTQETVLFNDTVRNNIAYGRPDVSMEQVRAAARAALAEEFIEELPGGYDTVIGERGLRLSGGQRQRLAIARALVKDAPILILDEATSELDTESEWLVQQALANLMQGRTVFVIAHRLSTVRRADQILVLEEGKIVERGRHDDLLLRRGVYHRLYEMQFADAPVTSAPEVQA